MTKQQLCIFLLACVAAVVSGFSSSTASPRSSSSGLQASQQGEYGKSLERPDTYAHCGRCETAYSIKEEDLGNGRGRRLECSVCGHSWFQSRDRLMTLSGGFEMVELPDMIHNRIKTNIEQGKSPKYTGDSKLYVGNIAFASTEKDIFDLFADIGEVGDVALVRDEIGRNRGFGFVTMRTKEGGEKAMEKLDGSELNGRNIAVRESNN